MEFSKSAAYDNFVDAMDFMLESYTTLNPINGVLLQTT